MGEQTPDTTRSLLWLSEVRGSLSQGYVRVHAFVDPETLSVRLEVEHCDFLGMGWLPMPQIG